MQRTRREPTVRRLGLNLTDSVVAVAAGSGRDVLRPKERERARENARERERGTPCERRDQTGVGVRALLSSILPPAAYRVPRASTIISVRQRCSAPRTPGRFGARANTVTEGFIIFTRRYRANPTILIPRREEIGHLAQRPVSPRSARPRSPPRFRSRATGGLRGPPLLLYARYLASRTDEFIARSNRQRLRTL